MVMAISPSDRDQVTAFFAQHWGGSDMVISSGVYDCSTLPGFMIKQDHKIVGLITYCVRENEIEVISLDSAEEGKGIGSALMEAVEMLAYQKKCGSVSLITTNDNLHALRFYQKRGYRMAELLPDAVAQARAIKPSIPLMSEDGIPIRDEIVLVKQILSSKSSLLANDKAQKKMMDEKVDKKDYLITKRFELRELVMNDWTDVHRYASQERVCQYQPWGPNTEEESRAFVEQAVKAASAVPRSRFAFAIMKEQKMIGTAELQISDFSNRAGELSYIVHPDHWGEGVATEAAKWLVQFGFQQLDLHRIFATCDPRNKASEMVLKKIGMSFEGTVRDDLLLRDGWRNSQLYSILEHEFHL